MSRLRAYRFAGPPVFRLTSAASCSPDVQRQVDECWQRSLSEKQEPTWDGPIVTLLEANDVSVVLGQTTYRYYVAARAGIDLGVPFFALGVSGLASCGDGFVLGQRNEKLAIHGGFWECAPAGSAESEDLELNLLRELREELGISPNLTRNLRAVGLVLDSNERVADIAYSVHLELTADQIRNLHRHHGSDEYSQIAIVPPNRLAAFLDDHRGFVLPNVPLLLGLVDPR